jgi:CheY-like chemotaxis protein
MVVKLILEKLGLTMTLVSDGQQAVEALMHPISNNSPDLILMDLHMPVLDGYAATEQIRQWEADNQRTRLPIIALTADAFEEDRQHCLAVGMDDFLTKPISINALASALGEWLPAVRTRQVPLQAQMAFKPLDAPAFVILVEQLTPLLQQNKFAAISLFNQLQGLVSGTTIEAEIDALAASLRDMRFDLVLPRLLDITKRIVGQRIS